MNKQITMKSSISIKIVIWGCNIALVILALSFLLGLFYYAKFPSLIAPNIDLEGVIKSSYQVSQNLMGDNYVYERVIDQENGIDEENYYFASAKNVYRVSFSDSLALSANKINQDLSSSESKYFGLIQKKTIVTEPAGDVPVRFAAPAVSLDKEKFASYARSNVLRILFVILYGMGFLWFLRKFITGLRNPGFFTRKNAYYLKLTAWLAIAAPFLFWLWNTLVSPDLFADLQFASASEVSTSFSQPLVMLLFGLVLLSIAWSFDHGVKLQEEQELTI